MRVLVLMRGLPGSGKSTWIKDNGLEAYSLSADNLRLFYQAPQQCPDGTYTISQENNKPVWGLILQVLEQRMSRGDFTVIDACHVKPSDFSKYRQLAEDYRYRVYCVDFSKVPIDTVKTQNRNRLVLDPIRYVSEAVIDRMALSIGNPPPGFVTVLQPDQAMDIITYKPTDLSGYNKVHHIGDLHGCCSVLLKFFNSCGLNDNEYYIFCGDYIDRGIENAATLKIIFSLMNRGNVAFLEGNHERWLWMWANDKAVKSREFDSRTRPQLEAGGIDKKDVRMFYRKLRQLVYYTFDGKTFMVSHGGLATSPVNPVFISTEQYIKGVGRYEDKVNDTFGKLSPDVYQIHGHRNIPHDPVKINDNCFNLCDLVEEGGNLRVLTLTHESVTGCPYEIHLFKNDVFREKMEREDNLMNADLIARLRANKNIKERVCKDISSFNFTKDVFYNKSWNEQTVKARGLFINNKTGEIVARSYDKFFNIGERPETEPSYLEKHLVFPVDVYIKENGYLGLVGYASVWDDLVITSKSTIDGEFAVNFAKIFNGHSYPKDENKDTLKQFLKENNCNLVFEVIDPAFDPHVIEYPTKDMILLDVVQRTAEYKKLPYLDMLKVADRFGFNYKKQAARLSNWEQFVKWQEGVINADCSSSLLIRHVEGYVIEDATGLMVKLKLPWYSTWKYLRTLKDRVAKKLKDPIFISEDSLDSQFYQWLKTLPPEELQRDIIYLRKKYYSK